MNFKKILRLTGCIILTLLVGGVSGFITAQSITGWYTTLVKPSFNPPNYVFGPVWTFLYILMGFSLNMILNQPASINRTQAIAVFGVQLFLNFWWSIIFFSFHRLGFAMAEIVLMWASIIWMIVAFVRLKPWAGYLQIPYLLWVSFASVLNLAIMLLN